MDDETANVDEQRGGYDDDEGISVKRKGSIHSSETCPVATEVESNISDPVLAELKRRLSSDEIDWKQVGEWLLRNAESIRASPGDATTALHLLCQHGAPLEAVTICLDIDQEAAWVKDHLSMLPVHWSCVDRRCDFDVIQLLVDLYPSSLGEYTRGKSASSRGGRVSNHTPFGWDASVRLGQHFTEFVAYLVSDDLCRIDRSSVEASTRTINLRKKRWRLLSHCKNYVPLDILQKGMLDEENLKQSGLIRFLNELPVSHRSISVKTCAQKS